MINFFKKKYSDLKNLFLKDFESFKKSEKLKMKENFKSEQDISQEYFKEEIINNEKLLKELQSKLPNIDNIEKIDIASLNLNNGNLKILISDDHPGALFQMKSDIKAVLEKKYEFFNIDDKIKEKIENLNFSINTDLIQIGSELAPYKIIDLIENQNLIIDFAILDIVFGGVVLKDNKSFFYDGIDIAKSILKKNNKAIILFYSGCTLNDKTEEAIKLKNMLNDYADNLFFTDKDLNDNVRLDSIINSLEKVKRNLK